MAILGIGSKISYSTDGSTFTDVAEVTSITLPSVEHTVVENVHLGITDGFKDFLIGLADGGDVTFKYNYAATVYSALDAIRGKMKVSTNDVKWKITSPDPDGAGSGVPSTYTFKGVLTAMSGEITTEEIMSVDCTVKVRGAVTIA